MDSLELYKGTLDVLLLSALRDGPLHGYAVSRSVRDSSDDAFQIEEGALYTALRRLERRGALESEWRESETGRRARFYSLTEKGRKELSSRKRSWHRYVAAMNLVLGSGPASEEGS